MSYLSTEFCENPANKLTDTEQNTTSFVEVCHFDDADQNDAGLWGTWKSREKLLKEASVSIRPVSRQLSRPAAIYSKPTASRENFNAMTRWQAANSVTRHQITTVTTTRKVRVHVYNCWRQYLHDKLRTSFSLLHKSNIKDKDVYIVSFSYARQ